MIDYRSVLSCAVFVVVGCAGEAGDPGAPAPPVTVEEAFKQDAAARLAGALADPAARDAIVGALRARGPIALAELPGFAAAAAPGGGAVPEVWLHEPAGAAGVDLLVAYAPAGDERSWTEVPAYTLSGARVALDPRHAPAVAVVVIETHGRLAMREGIAEANRVLQRAGLQGQPGVALAAGPTATSRLDSIRLTDDLEPWVSGAAEVYAVVSGVIGDNVPQLAVVELPYLDNDGTTYAPNQIVINWSGFTFQAANLQVFEHDDSTSFQQLVMELVSAVGAIGSLAGHPEIQAVTEIANRIIAVMPAGWFSNDDDFVDSFYTLEKTRTYRGLVGAARNATISLTPFTLQPN